MFPTSITPYQYKVRESSVLELNVLIEHPDGWLDLNDHQNYRVANDALAEGNHSFRRLTATSPYVHGSYTITSVPDNIEETLSVWVLGGTRADLAQNIQYLTDALQQITFGIVIKVEDYSVLWTCFASEYKVSTRHELMHSRMGQVVAQVPRLPKTSEIADDWYIYQEKLVPAGTVA